MQDKPQPLDDALGSETLITLVTQVTGQAVTALEPLAKGESTAAYRVATQDDDLVVRIQKRGVIGFAEEAWAMRRCLEVGLPVPEVLGIS